MKVTVTALKAPWPQGTQVGDTVDLPGDSVPGWAAGKCVPAQPEKVAAEAAVSAAVDAAKPKGKKA